MKRCDRCRVVLDGVQRQPHTLMLVRDGLLVHGGTFCLEHLERLEQAYREARAALDDQELVAR